MEGRASAGSFQQSFSEAMPCDGTKFTITKTGTGTYRRAASKPGEVNAAIQLQSDGSYSMPVPAEASAQFSKLANLPGASFNVSPVQIWVHGDTLFLDSHVAFSGQPRGIPERWSFSGTGTMKTSRVR